MSKITEMNGGVTTTPSNTDIIPYVHDPGGTPSNKIATVSDLLGLATGGSVSWTAGANESGASMTNFDVYDGTWASNGTIIQQTNASASWFNANVKRATAAPRSWSIFEAEVRSPGSTYIGIGIGRGYDPGQAPTYKGFLAFLNIGSSRLTGATLGGQSYYDYGVTLNNSTWYKIRLVKLAHSYEVYLDGTYAMTVSPDDTADNGQRDDGFTLASYGAGDFRNIKSWNVSSSFLNYPA